VVVFANTIHVMKYNGAGVEDTWYSNGKYRTNTVTLPAGETLILFIYHFSIVRGDTKITITGRNIELCFDFEAGKEYTVASYTKKKGFLLLETEYGVAVWNRATTSNPGRVDKSIKSWKLGET
jgi:hypothetical protein